MNTPLYANINARIKISDMLSHIWKGNSFDTYFKQL